MYTLFNRQSLEGLVVVTILSIYKMVVGIPLSFLWGGGSFSLSAFGLMMSTLSHSREAEAEAELHLLVPLPLPRCLCLNLCRAASASLPLPQPLPHRLRLRLCLAASASASLSFPYLYLSINICIRLYLCYLCVFLGGGSFVDEPGLRRRLRPRLGQRLE